MRKIKLYGSKGVYELEPEKVYTNDVRFAHEGAQGEFGLYVICHEFGAICAVWAASPKFSRTLQDATCCSITNASTFRMSILLHWASFLVCLQKELHIKGNGHQTK